MPCSEGWSSNGLLHGKIDRETANSDKIKEQLSSINILLEDWEVNFSPKRFQQKQGQGNR